MSLLAEAIARIKELLDEAKASDLREPTAMSVATVDELGRPAVRTVLLKHLDESGLVFFINRKSRKGMHLQAVPYAAGMASARRPSSSAPGPTDWRPVGPNGAGQAPASGSVCGCLYLLPASTPAGTG